MTDRERDDLIAERLAQLEGAVRTVSDAVVALVAESTELTSLLRATREADADRFDALERRVRQLEAAE